MGIVLSQSDDACLIGLDGAIDIASAAELKAVLVEALETGKEIRISTAETADLDITAFQLLWAAKREAAQSGVGFALAGPLPEPVRNSLAVMGLDGPGILSELGGR
ncbi:MAG: STAS domain-containing protein [Terracidiphilus sp.]